MKQIRLNGDYIVDIPSFYQEVNQVFMLEEDWKIGNSLDAFSDLLYGGVGVIKGNEPVNLIWNNIDRSREALGYETTRRYYQEKLKPGSPFNQEYFGEQLSALENGTGKTYFDIILEIIGEHKNITLTTESQQKHPN
jgi:RNAse (barnase) inhibitor barstar